MALRNNFRATKKFLNAKFDCSKQPNLFSGTFFCSHDAINNQTGQPQMVIYYFHTTAFTLQVVCYIVKKEIRHWHLIKKTLAYPFINNLVKKCINCALRTCTKVYQGTLSPNPEVDFTRIIYTLGQNLTLQSIDIF